VLTFVPSVDLQGAGLGPHSLVITDGVPNDLPFVGGLITEAFQTPLAHINVLSRARGTPNMALTDARTHPRLAPLLGKLVRLDVEAADFAVREASPEEAEAFWEAQHPSGPRVVPPSNPSVRGIQPLEARRFADAPAIGTKAAQFAELYRVVEPYSNCGADTVPLRVPGRAFAIPVAHYLDHLRASGADELLVELEADPAFRTDPAVRAEGLESLRSLMLATPVESELLAAVESAIEERFGAARVRLRSSSNTEDLPEFNGAGLHTSVSAEVGSTKLSVEDGLRTVWASLWNLRAYDEREFANIEQSRAAMGVLVHLAMPGEAAQGVAISRNMLDVTRNGIYTINAQVGRGLGHEPRARRRHRPVALHLAAPLAARQLSNAQQPHRRRRRAQRNGHPRRRLRPGGGAQTLSPAPRPRARQPPLRHANRVQTRPGQPRRHREASAAPADPRVRAAHRLPRILSERSRRGYEDVTLGRPCRSA
jgi:hypothetical protein